MMEPTLGLSALALIAASLWVGASRWRARKRLRLDTDQAIDHAITRALSARGWAWQAVTSASWRATTPEGAVLELERHTSPEGAQLQADVVWSLAPARPARGAAHGATRLRLSAQTDLRALTPSDPAKLQLLQGAGLLHVQAPLHEALSFLSPHLGEEDLLIQSPALERLEWSEALLRSRYALVVSGPQAMTPDQGLARVAQHLALTREALVRWAQLEWSERAEAVLRREDPRLTTLSLDLLLHQPRSPGGALAMSWLQGRTDRVQMRRLWTSHASLLQEHLPQQALLTSNPVATPALAQALLARFGAQALLQDEATSGPLRLELTRALLGQVQAHDAASPYASALERASQDELPKLLDVALARPWASALLQDAQVRGALRSRVVHLNAPHHERLYERFAKRQAVELLLPHYAAMLASRCPHPALPKAGLLALLDWPGWRPDQALLRQVAALSRDEQLATSRVARVELWGALLRRDDWPVAPLELLVAGLPASMAAWSLTLSAQEQDLVRRALPRLLAKPWSHELRAQAGLTLLWASAQLGDLPGREADQAASADLIRACLQTFDAMGPAHPHIEWAERLLPHAPKASIGPLKDACARWRVAVRQDGRAGSLTLAPDDTARGGLSVSDRPPGALTRADDEEP